MGLRVLVVDDDEGSRDGLCRLLKCLGHQPESVSSGEEALGVAGKTDYDLIFMDYRMGSGKLNGLDTTKRIRQMNLSVPVYMFSADEFKDGQLRDAGATGYIRKGSSSQIKDIESALENSSPKE